jgi:carbon starvation protein
VVALSVGTTVIINIGKARYAWVTAAPLTLLTVNTLWGAFLNIRDNYYPMATGDDVARQFQGWVLTISSVIIIVCALVILAASIRKWMSVTGGAQQVVPTES